MDKFAPHLHIFKAKMLSASLGSLPVSIFTVIHATVLTEA